MVTWERSLTEVLALNPEHVSAYALKVEPATPMGRAGVEPDSDLQADMYLSASERLTAAGYEHYEISNFSKPGFPCRHNRLYWENQDTIALGVSAVSYVAGRRWKNPTALGHYMTAIEKGELKPMEESRLDPEAFEREKILLGLRLNSGVPREEMDRLELPVTHQFLDAGLARVEGGRYRLTPQGWLLSNQLFQHLV